MTLFGTIEKTDLKLKKKRKYNKLNNKYAGWTKDTKAEEKIQ